MTIQYAHQPIATSQDEFQKVDYQVMGHAFTLHNEMGNLWEEKEYQHALASKCRATGLEVFEEVVVSISHNGFKKKYYIDLLIDGNIYELKTAVDIAPNHRARTLNYLFLTDTQHGKIINFGSGSLTWHFISTSLSLKDRLSYSLRTAKWQPATNVCLNIPDLMNDLLSDWGTYLSITLYKEALCHFLNIPLENEHQRFVSLSPKTALHISGLDHQKIKLQPNLQKYLDTSSFDELLWINFHRNIIEFSSLHHSAQ